MTKKRAEPLPLEVRQLLAPFFPGFDLSRIRIYEGIPCYVVGIGKAGPIGYANRHRIYFAPGAYRVDTAEGLSLIAHEIEHCRQYKQHGTWRFRAAYLAAYVKNRRHGMTGPLAYFHIPFETAAREVEREVYSSLLRMQAALVV